MTFQKGNKLAAGHKKAHQVAWQNMGGKFINEFTQSYMRFMEKLSKGEKLSKEELEFMNRFENQEEFFQPKLARMMLEGNKDNPINVQMVDFKSLNNVHKQE